MTNWKAASAAFAPDIPEDQLDRITAALNGLEAAFRPLVSDIPAETEPAYVLLVDRKSVV